MRRKLVLPFLLGSIAAMGQPSPWDLKLPKPDCKVTPWLDSCPDHDKFMKPIQLAPLYVPPTSTPRHAAPSPSAPPGPVSNVDWRKPLSAEPLPANWPRWRFAPSDASLVFGMKLPALLRSKVVHELDGGADFDPSKLAAEEVWISMRENHPPQAPESVMLLIGPTLYPIATSLRSKGFTVCFLDARSVLAGEWNAVNRAVQRVLGEAAPAGSGEKRTSELWANSDVLLLPGRKWTPEPETVSRLEVGVSVKEKLNFDMHLRIAKPVDAERLVDRFRKDPAELDLPNGATGVEIRKLADGVSVRASLDAGSLPDALRRQISGQLKPVLELGQAATAPQRAAGGVIVIDGLAGGLKVIRTSPE
jgi:hypothetical protein